MTNCTPYDERESICLADGISEERAAILAAIEMRAHVLRVRYGMGDADALEQAKREIDK